jgi:flagellar protein FlbT
MRERHILKEEDANTPVRRLYFALQMLYIEPARKEDFLPMFERYAKDLQNAITIPEMKFAVDQIITSTHAEQYYEALKICRAMIETEDNLFEYGRAVNEKMAPNMPEIPADIDFAALAARAKAEAAAGA